MEERIYLFNPDNDLALAHGGGHYVSPPFAQKMQADLCVLPMWYAQPQSRVVVENEQMRGWVDDVSRQYQLQVKGILREELSERDAASFCPWGWSGTIKRRLMKNGVSSRLLPSDEWLAQVRLLAHRRSSIAVHQFLRRHCSLPFSPVPVEYADVAEVLRFAMAHRGCYVKMPWSGSGQGVYHAIEPQTREFEQWCRGAIRRQQSLLCEPGLQRVMEFAMEFECFAGQSNFLGYSVFESDFHSQYQCGIVAREEELLRLICEKYPQFQQVAPLVKCAVDQLFAPHYQGYLGIDMLLFNHQGSIQLNPCVEVNVRATMGLVTAQVGHRLLQGGKKGKFRIAFSKNAIHEMRPNRFYLTPIFPNTQYCAYIDWD